MAAASPRVNGAVRRASPAAACSLEAAKPLPPPSPLSHSPALQETLLQAREEAWGASLMQAGLASGGGKMDEGRRQKCRQTTLRMGIEVLKLQFGALKVKEDRLAAMLSMLP